MTHRIASKFKNFFMRSIRPSLCQDCKHKMDRKFNLGHKVRHGMRKAAHHVKHKLRPGVHKVRINGKLRKVHVLASGKWRFMKG